MSHQIGCRDLKEHLIFKIKLVIKVSFLVHAVCLFIVYVFVVTGLNYILLMLVYFWHLFSLYFWTANWTQCQKRCLTKAIGSVHNTQDIYQRLVYLNTTASIALHDWNPGSKYSTSTTMRTIHLQNRKVADLKIELAIKVADLYSNYYFSLCIKLWFNTL